MPFPSLPLAPPTMPPLNLDLGSSAKSGQAQGGAVGSSGWGSMSSGNWILQRTGTGDNTATPLGPKSGMALAICAAVAWFLLRK